jgi:23S rRNA pseudouridine955/2504/2580 synthase
MPRGALYRLIRTGQVRVNGGRAKPDRKLVAGDAVRIPPAAYREPGDVSVSEAVCRQVEQAVLFEDDDVLVIDKPSGMAVHAGSGLPWGLIDAVRQIRADKRIELVHRIDRDTSGCLVLACSPGALESLATQFREGRVGKRYLCLLSRRLEQAVVEIDAPILAGRRGGEKHMTVDSEGREAVTRFTCLEQYSRACYASAEILTGRTHQIRVHAAHLGLPLAGDRKYGSDSEQALSHEIGLRRLFLHAAELDIELPGGERMTFSSPLPPALRQCLDNLAGLDSYVG